MVCLHTVVVCNGTTFIQLLVVAIPALIAMGIASLLDGDGHRWAEIVGSIALVPLDLLWRLASIGGSEAAIDEQVTASEVTSSEGTSSEGTSSEGTSSPGERAAAGGLLQLVSPDGGGHIFFLPNYLVGVLVTYGLFSGFFA